MIETDKGDDNPNLPKPDGATKVIAFIMLGGVFGLLYWLFMQI